MDQLCIDINCDMGESYGRFEVGNDEAVFPYITSANIACGYHGGDPLHIEKTIETALRHNVRIGAHPAYPDLMGFGRRKMHIPASELRALVKYQVAALKGMTESLGGKLEYVKPHGALYNSAADNEAEAAAILEALEALDPDLRLMGLAGSRMQQLALDRDRPFIAEAFADRRYENDGRLRSRLLPDAVIASPEAAAAQVVAIARENRVISAEGHPVPVAAQSVCIHGDNPQSVAILQAIDRALAQQQIRKTAYA